MYFAQGITANNLNKKPMLTTNLNATYDDFVPYTGSTGKLNSDVASLSKNNTIKNDYMTQNITVTANKIYDTYIDYSSIQGKIIWSNVTWNNPKTETPITMAKYQDENGKITRIAHSWSSSQTVSFRVAVLKLE